MFYHSKNPGQGLSGQNPRSGVVQKPRSQVVSDLPCSRNPGPRWSLILGTGDRDRRPRPAPVPSPLAADVRNSFFSIFFFVLSLAQQRMFYHAIHLLNHSTAMEGGVLGLHTAQFCKLSGDRDAGVICSCASRVLSCPEPTIVGTTKGLKVDMPELGNKESVKAWLGAHPNNAYLVCAFVVLLLCVLLCVCVCVCVCACVRVFLSEWASECVCV
jgi:hypothetical protein